MFYHSKIRGPMPYRCPHCQEADRFRPDHLLVLRYSWGSLLRFLVISAALFVIAMLGIMPQLDINNIAFYCIVAAVVSAAVGYGTVLVNIKLLYALHGQVIHAIRCCYCHHAYLVVSPIKKGDK